MNDFYEAIRKHLKDENEDASDYEELAEKASDPGQAQILRDIAREERVHAAHLEYILRNGNSEAVKL